MKAIFWSLMLTFSAFSLVGQSFTDPVSWDYEISDNGTNKDLKIHATIQDGWVIYSQFTPDGGPIATEFGYDQQVLLEGKTEEINEPIRMMDDMFEIEVLKFKSSADFLQVLAPAQEDIKMTKVDITYMSCNDKTCLPPKNHLFRS